MSEKSWMIILMVIFTLNAYDPSGLILEVDLKFTDSTPDTCDLTITIDNQEYISYLGKKGAIACLAVPKDDADTAYAELNQDVQYPGFLFSGTVPTLNTTDKVFKPSYRPILGSWGGSKYANSWVYKFVE